ncbi:MAG: glycosyltransferase family 4 protein [Armatimonadota bacterium]
MNFFRGQIAYLREHGIEVSVICSPGELLEAFVQKEQVPGYGVEMPRRITPLRDVIALIQLVRILRKVRPHLVHANTPKGGLLGMISAWLCRVPVRIYHIRGLPFLTASGWKRRVLRWSEKIACRLAHSVLCVSHSSRQIAVQEDLCAEDKIRVLASGSGQGVDADGRFNPARFGEEARRTLRRAIHIPEEATVIGYVGRIVRDKGMEELAKAWTQLRERYPNLHLLLVGDYEPQDPVSDTVRRLFLNDPRVILTGWVSDTAPYYALMDVLALPSYREGFPNTPLEASAMCVPVVATRIPGCVDAVVDGLTGVLVPARDAQALAEAIERYICQPHLRIQHGRAGRERVLREFRQEVLWQALYEHYQSLMQEKGIIDR